MMCVCVLLVKERWLKLFGCLLFFDNQMQMVAKKKHQQIFVEVKLGQIK